MTFNGLGLAISGMQAAQVGLDIAGNNIANTNTVGYSRKVVSFTEGVVSDSPTGKQRFYSGVQVENIRRIRDVFLDQQIREQSSSLGKERTISDLTVAMNDILGEPSDSGLTAKLNKFFQAAKDLATNPELQTAKTVFINSATSLSDSFNQIDRSIALLKNNLDDTPSGRINTVIKNLNTKLEELANVHQQVLSADGRNIVATELEDKRDVLLDEISDILDLNIVRDGSGKLSKLTMDVNASEANVTASTGFLNVDSAISAITSSANTLVLTVNNGAGITTPTTGAFTVNFEAGSSIREVVEKINQTFKASGGKGTLASINNNGALVLDTKLVDSSENNSTASIVIGAGSTALSALGLSAGTTTGSDSSEVTIMDSQGVRNIFDVEPGNNDTASFPSKLIIRTNSGSLPKAGTIDSFSGELGGYFQTTNKEIPEMRKMLSDFAMSIKKSVNDVVQLGQTASGNTGTALFTGSSAANFAVNGNIISNNSLLAQGATGAASDGSIAEEVSNLFFGTNNIVSDGARSEMLFINSSSSSAVQSALPVIPGQPITIYADGIIDDNGSSVNAGTNGFGAGSLVQIEFLDASGAVVGSTINFPSTAPGAPEDRVSYPDSPTNVPAGAAFVRFKMNPSFNDSSLSNNEGHFKISIIQGSENDDAAVNFNNKISDIVGEFGTRGNVAISKKDNADNLYTSLNNRRQSISGVSLEEEAAELIRFQNAFAANARVISVMNEVLQTLVNSF